MQGFLDKARSGLCARFTPLINRQVRRGLEGGSAFLAGGHFDLPSVPSCLPGGEEKENDFRAVTSGITHFLELADETQDG